MYLYQPFLQSGSMAGDLMTSIDRADSAMGRESAMSQAAGAVDPTADPNGRRMSDPVRPLDRNFGVGGQMSRHRSFGNLQAGGGTTRAPLHNQRVRGQDGGGYMGEPNQVIKT